MLPRRHSTILTATANGLTPVLLLVSLFLTFRGHNAPGGGFAGGLVMSSAVVLRYLADGPGALGRLRLDPVALIGVGLLVALGTALAPLLVDGQLLESAIWKFEVPVIGEVKLVSSTFFDIGVHLVVLGVITSVVYSLVMADEPTDGRSVTDPTADGQARR